MGAMVSTIRVAVVSMACVALLYRYFPQHEILHASLGLVPDPLKPSTDLAPPLGLHAECFKAHLEAPHIILFMSEGVALTTDRLPGHHPPPQALPSHARHKTAKQYASPAHRHLNALAASLGKRTTEYGHRYCASASRGIGGA